MKLTLLPFLLLIGNIALAQYKIELSNEPYVELTGATELVFEPSQGGYYHPTSLTLPCFKRKGDFSLVQSVSRGAYVTAQGYVAIYEKPDYVNTIVFHALFDNQFSQVAGVTKVSSKTEGTAPNRVLKFEWKDLVYGGNTAQTANFQAWFYENSGNIAYHYGPNTLPSAASRQPYIGTLVLNENFSAVLDQFSLTGTPTSKQNTSGYTSMTFPPVTGVPTDGSVITLMRFYTSVNDVSHTIQPLIYPNPASDELHLQLDGAQSMQVSIVNSVGTEVLNKAYENNAADVSLTNIPAGIYFVRLSADGHMVTRKIFIDK